MAGGDDRELAEMAPLFTHRQVDPHVDRVPVHDLAIQFLEETGWRIAREVPREDVRPEGVQGHVVQQMPVLRPLQEGDGLGLGEGGIERPQDFRR
jgi:hypothetical protein